jgi:sortase A
LRTKNILSWALSLVLLGAGVALIASFILAGSLGSSATNSEDPAGFSVPKVDSVRKEVAAEEPEDKTLTLTIPEMARIKNDTVPYAAGTDEQALKENAAIHLKGSGFPWQEEANVYLAGHRLGYPNTDSFLAFWDLNKLEEGDKVFLTDADGTKYTYEVFREMVVAPSDLSVTEPVEGKNVLTLQTCTLPDYSQRLIVQAELESIEEA